MHYHLQKRACIIFDLHNNNEYESIFRTKQNDISSYALLLFGENCLAKEITLYLQFL
jgi:hypothetical protein